VVLVHQGVALVASVAHDSGDEVKCVYAIIVTVSDALPRSDCVCCCFDLFECHLVGSFVLVANCDAVSVRTHIAIVNS
jgi:hypothetical protein